MNPYTREATGAMVAGILLVLLAFALAVVVAASKADGAEPRTLLAAIRQVESSGQDCCEDGDGGKAIGPYQIWHSYWTDSGVPGKYAECRGRAYAERVVRAYWRRYCPEAVASGDEERMAKIHHMGPRPERDPEEAERYWNKVKVAAKGG